VMTCKEFVTYIDRYVTRELSPAEHLAFGRHLSRCASCLHYLQGYLTATAAARASVRDDDDLPEEIPEQLVRAIVRARRHAGDVQG
jgi:anti-sigma factor RsiW